MLQMLLFFKLLNYGTSVDFLMLIIFEIILHLLTLILYYTPYLLILFFSTS